MAKDQIRVPALDRSYPVHSVTEDGQKVQVATANVRMYEGESVWRNSVLPQFETEEKQLKSTNKAWHPLDHYDALEPLLEAGWQFAQYDINRGGLNGRFLMTHPEGVRYQDLFDWDSDIWNHRDRDKDGGITEAILVQSPIRPGAPKTYRRGFFRFVCTNGLVDSALDLAVLKMNAENWSMADLQEKILATPHVTEEMIRGEKVGTPRGSQKFFEFLERYYLEPDNASVRDLPAFARDLIRPFDNIPEWVGLNAISQFHAISEAKVPVHRMDVMNAWTGAINMPSDTEHSVQGVLNKVERLTSATADLIGVYSM